MRLLVHLCCGPCAAYPMPHRLLLQCWRQQEGLDLSAFDLSR